MVGNLSQPEDLGDDRGGQDDRHSQNPNNPQRIESNHNIEHSELRRLIQGSLNPLIVDPVPTSIRIYNITITRDDRNRLDIYCDVSYEAVRRE